MSSDGPPFGGELKLAEPTTADRSVIGNPPPYSYEGRLVTAKDWVQQNITNDFLGRVKRYLISLFPIFSWIYRYNFTWFVGGTVPDFKRFI